MRYLIKNLLFILGMLTPMLVNAAAETYMLDSSHSAVTWQVSHFGFSNPSGKWYATGILNYDESNPQNSKITADIDMAKIITGIPKLDYNLLGTAFLNAHKYPKATFVSNKVTITGNNTFEVSGMLTLHGITHPLLLKAVFNKVGIHPVTNKKTAGFSATATIDRSDYGISTYLPGISDEVNLDIEVEAALVTKKGT